MIGLAVTGICQETTPKIEPEPVASPPVSYGLVIDNSGSFRLLLESVIKFVKAVVNENGPDDEAFLVRFVSSDKVTMEQGLTTSKMQLADAADEMYIEGGETAIIDAVNFSARHLSENARQEAGRSKLIVLVTDGDERKSISRLDDTIQLLKKANIRVFVVAIADGKIQPKTLDRFAKETGGRVFLMKTQGELRMAAKDLAAAMRKQ